MKGKVVIDTPSIVVGELFRRGRPREAPLVIRRESEGALIETQLTAFEDHIECIFGRSLRGAPQEVQYTVPVSWTRPNYGGRRPWFHCPSQPCQRRVGRLFLTGAYFLCRQCAGVRYASQDEPLPSYARRAERASAIRARLGGSTDFPLVVVVSVCRCLPWLLPSQIGLTQMHDKTYRALRQECLAIEGEEINRAVLAGELSFGRRYCSRRCTMLEAVAPSTETRWSSTAEAAVATNKQVSSPFGGFGGISGELARRQGGVTSPSHPQVTP